MHDIARLSMCWNALAKSIKLDSSLLASTPFDGVRLDDDKCRTVPERLGANTSRIITSNGTLRFWTLFWDEYNP